MVDKRISELSAIDALVDADLLECVDDVAGTPASKKATFAQLFTYLQGKFGSFAGLNNPLTTKGDLLIRNATVIDRLAAGTNGYVLEADSTVGAGVKWAAKASAGKILQVQSTTWSTETNFSDAFNPGDSVPANTAGAERFTLAMTPLSAASDLYITASIPIYSAVGTTASGEELSPLDFGLEIAAALFRDATVNAIATDILSWQLTRPENFAFSPSFHGRLLLEARVASAAAVETTFKVRTGRNLIGTGTPETRHNGPDTMGGFLRSRMDIWEIAA